jgi:hypothetical protein
MAFTEAMRKKAAAWHGSPEGLVWHAKNGKKNIKVHFKKGHEVPEKWKEHLREIKKGKRFSPDTEFKKGVRSSPLTELGANGKGVGKNHWNWKGGITPESVRLRASAEYKLWHEAVFKRDSYTCVWCGDSRGSNLRADHIQLWSEYPELRFAIDNGRTLCESCHIKRHKK